MPFKPGKSIITKAAGIGTKLQVTNNVKILTVLMYLNGMMKLMCGWIVHIITIPMIRHWLTRQERNNIISQIIVLICRRLQKEITLLPMPVPMVKYCKKYQQMYMNVRVTHVKA